MSSEELEPVNLKTSGSELSKFASSPVQIDKAASANVITKQMSELAPRTESNEDSQDIGRVPSRNYSEADIPIDTSPLSGTVNYIALSPFEKIKLESDRRTAHGHPVILPTEYGMHGPAYDVLAVFHNAVKKQILVGYNTLEGLQRYKYAVTRAETKMFFIWLDVLTDSIFALLSIEEDEIFPFLEENKVQLHEGVTREERMKSKDNMAACLQQVDKARDMLRLLPPGEAIPRIIRVVPTFFNVVIEYYKTQGAFLPTAIRNAEIDEAKCSQLRAKIMRAMRASKNYGTYVVFVSHWLRGARLREWKRNYLGTIATLRYDQYVRKFANNYQTIPGRLVERLMSATAAGDSIDGSSSNLSFYLNKKKNAYKV